MHVYCTNCQNGGALIDFILDGGVQPIDCQDCCPWNPEDSMELKDRPNYKEQNQDSEKKEDDNPTLVAGDIILNTISGTIMKVIDVSESNFNIQFKDKNGMFTEDSNTLMLKKGTFSRYNTRLLARDGTKILRNDNGNIVFIVKSNYPEVVVCAKDNLSNMEGYAKELRVEERDIQGEDIVEKIAITKAKIDLYQQLITVNKRILEFLKQGNAY